MSLETFISQSSVVSNVDTPQCTDEYDTFVKHKLLTCKNTMKTDNYRQKCSCKWPRATNWSGVISISNGNFFSSKFGMAGTCHIRLVILPPPNPSICLIWYPSPYVNTILSPQFIKAEWYTLLAKSNDRFFVFDFLQLSNLSNVFNFGDNIIGYEYNIFTKQKVVPNVLPNVYCVPNITQSYFSKSSLFWVIY